MTGHILWQIKNFNTKKTIKYNPVELNFIKITLRNIKKKKWKFKSLITFLGKFCFLRKFSSEKNFLKTNFPFLRFP